MTDRTVLFVCVENACRSLMAEAMFNADPPPGWRGISAGTSPSTSPNPRTAPMLREIGLEPPGHAPQLLTLPMMEGSKIRVTMGCLDDANCPARLKELDYRDWALPNPASLDDAGFRDVRDKLQRLIEGLRREIPPERPPAPRTGPSPVTPSLLQRTSAELVGTGLLVGIGTAAIVAGARAGGVPQSWLAVAWFAAVAVPILLFARISGAHLNPVVTLGLVAARRFPVRELPPYVAAQILGAFGGSLAVLACLGDSAHLGATLPADGNLPRTFVLEAVFTLLLVLSVLWLTSEGKFPREWELLTPPAVVGLSTLLIGPLTGSSLNPARSLAPGVLSGDLTGFWIYLVSTIVGSLAAVAVLRLTRSLTAEVPGMGQPSRPSNARNASFEPSNDNRLGEGSPPASKPFDRVG